MSTFTDWRAPLEGLTIPHHIAVVMDGNGRWAKQRGLPRLQGHYEGRKATKRCIYGCSKIGVRALSIYAFSVENWRRPPEEVHGLMALITQSLRDELDELDHEAVRFRASGRLHELPAELQDAIARGVERTRDNAGMTLNLLMNYGGRAELADTARALAQRAAAGELAPETIDEDTLAQALYAPELPDVDLMIRPGGEYRVSNFLLWQIAYSEIVFLPVLWPEFDRSHLVEAIAQYNQRERRFGSVQGVATDEDLSDDEPGAPTEGA